MHSIRCLPDEALVPFEGDGVNLMSTLVARGVPLTRACGGRARCSTCRVAVLEGLDRCAPRNEAEAAMAQRLGFPDEVRLACQTGVQGDLAVRRLVLDDEDARLTTELGEEGGGNPRGAGTERFVAVLFADIAGFTTLSDRLPAFDVVHLLNRYFASAGSVIENRSGRISNYVGDGLLGLFDGAAAARNATAAGLDLLTAARDLDEYVRGAYGSPFSIRVGVHCGLAVVGAVGARGDRRETVIGDTVNVAARVEAANKEAGTRMLVTCGVRRRIDPDFGKAEPSCAEPAGSTAELEPVEVEPAIEGTAPSAPAFEFGRVCETELRGKSRSFVLHEVVGFAGGGSD